ncbi:trans-2,3-enoyl-CoA reductase-like [Protopterus annectens]|uniref:trans-2,3-enoyl-CoA reductase-like n=1 Tax=Protopterus annectens TaxID=7888 RepID=UPI001CFB28C2|nr:trans-2,3-enoyl-CoA reductase-like [Protopterus annectens]
MSSAKHNHMKAYLSFSELAIMAGHLRPSLAGRHSKIPYYDVEILDANTKQQLCVLEKVPASSTILDIKNKFRTTCPHCCPSHVGLRLDRSGPCLKETKVIHSLASSSIVTLYSINIGPQISWITAFLSQYTGALFIYLLFYFRLPSFYNSEHTRNPSDSVVHMACFCYCFHYIRLILEIIFIHKIAGGYTPLRNIFKGCILYWGFSAWIAYYINHPLYTPPSFGDNQTVPAMTVFLLCEVGNYFINLTLVHHNESGDITSLPCPTFNPFTWLFRLVSCPNYTYETGAWISFTIMTQTLPAAIFTGMMFIQMSLWAKKKHEIYLRNMKNNCNHMMSIIPFLI